MSVKTVTITSPAPAYYRNQSPLKATHVLANMLEDVVVGTACGRIFAFARAHLTLDETPAVSCDSCKAAA
jgi:capsular polysaccharide biosynthesis protein